MTKNRFKSLMLTVAVLLWDPDALRRRERDPSQHLDRKLLRILSHKCWWKDGFCCNDDMKVCYLCTNRCQGGNYVIGKYNSNPFCCCGYGNDCNKSDGKNGTNCRLNKDNTAIALTFARNSGTQRIYDTFEDLFTSNNKAWCGYYNCRAMIRQSGPNIDGALTTVSIGGQTDLDTNQCPAPAGTALGVSIYKANCGAEDKLFWTSMNISITVTDFCTSITPHTHPILAYLHNDSSNSVSLTKVLSGNFLTIVTTPSCVFNSCQIVSATSSSVCDAHGTTVSWITGTLAGSNIQLTINTSTVRDTLLYFCVSCESNQCDLKKFQSNPFQAIVNCKASGYTVGENASLVKEVIYILDGNAPTFPVDPFTYSEAACPITRIDFYDQDGVTTAPTGLTPAFSTGVTNRINVQATNIAIGGFYPFKMKVTLKGGQEHWANLAGDTTFILRVCGAETITKNLATDPSYEYYYQSQGTAALYEIQLADVVLWFTSTDPSCPIISYRLEKTLGFTYVGTDVYLIQVGSTWMLRISTANPVGDFFWVRANTGSGITNSQLIWVRVCGDETVSLTTGIYPTFFKYDKNTGNQQHSAAIVDTAFTNLDPFCTIFTYQCSTSSSSFVASSVCSIDGTRNQLSATTTSGYFNVWIMASTRTPISNWYAIQILICGIELIPGKLPTVPSYYYTWNTGTFTIEADLLNNWFSNTEPIHCPIVAFTLHTGPAPTYTPYTGQVIVSVANGLQVNTLANNIKVNLFVRAETRAPVYGYQEFNVLICGQETVSLLATSKPEFKYYSNIGTPPNFIQIPQDVKLWFVSSDDPNCAVINWVIEEKLPSLAFQAYAGTDIYLNSGAGSTMMLNIKTFAPINKDFYIKANTLENKFNRQIFWVRVCGDEIITVIPNYPTFFKYYVNRGQMTHSTTVEPAFYNPDPFCDIYQYKMSTSSSSVQTSTIGSVNQNWIQEIQTHTAGRFYFWIHAMTRTPIIAIYKIEVLICGLEQVAGIKVPNPYFYKAWNSGTFSLESNLNNWFSNTEAIECPFVKFTLHILDANSNLYVPYSNSQITIPGVFSLDLNTLPYNQKMSLAVKAETYSPKLAYQQFDFLICGEEKVTATSDKLLYIFQKDTGNQKTGFRSWMESTFQTICPIVTWTLHDYDQTKYSTYSGGIVSVDATNHDLVISTTSPSRFYIWLKGTTIGGAINYVKIEIEICGNEVVEWNPGVRKYLIFEYLQYSGGFDYTHVVHPRNFFQLVHTTSNNCLIDVPSTRLYYENGGTLSEFNGDRRVWMRGNQAYMHVRTADQYILNLFMMVKTLSSPKFYIPLTIKIIEKPFFEINDPPYFFLPDGYMLNYTVNEPQEVYNLTWNVTQQGDDHAMLDNMTFNHSEFGNLAIKYENLTMKPYFHSESYQSMMSYNISSTEFKISVKGGLDAISRFVGPIYLIRAKLYDQQGLSAKKDLWLNVTLNYSAPEIVRKDPEYELEVIGKVDHISVFGEVDILFTQNRMPLNQIPVENINNTHISIYIEPSEGWDRWRDQEVSTVNFTWKVKELTKEKMRIKLDLEDSIGVSPLLRYDSLVIHFKDVRALFIDERQRRRLSPNILQSTFDGPMQKQMIDNKNARETIKAVYSLRSALVLMFAIFLAFSFGLQGPLDRMITMLLELQLMSYLCLLHVPLPANVVISSQVMRPFISFHLLEIMGSGEYDVAEELENLGQRMTFGYETFEAYYNMDTLGFIFAIYILKVVFTGFVSLYSLWKHKNEKLKEWRNKLLGEILFSDLMFIFVFGMMELGAAAVLNMYDPFMKNSEEKRLNFSIACLCIFLGLFSLPYIYSHLIKKSLAYDSNGFRNEQFQQKYARFMFGADLTKNRNKGNLSYIFSFWFKRYSILLVSFWIEHTGAQIMILITVFMFSSAMFAKNMPVYGAWGKAIGLFNQLSLVLVYIHLVAFTDFLDKESQYASGYSLLTLIQTFIAVNFLYVNVEFVRCVWLLCTQLCPDFLKWLNAIIWMLKKLWNLKSHVRCPKFKIPLPSIEITYNHPLEDVMIPKNEEVELILSERPHPTSNLAVLSTPTS